MCDKDLYRQTTLYLSSDGDIADNNDTESLKGFKIQLGEPLKLDESKWLCGLVEIQIPQQIGTLHSVLYVCCNICSGSLVNNRKLPILRALLIGSAVSRKIKNVKYHVYSFSHIAYVPIRQRELQDISLYITDSAGNDVSFERGTIHCALHIRQQHRY